MGEIDHWEPKKVSLWVLTRHLTRPDYVIF
jgi:hypothetical protein